MTDPLEDKQYVPLTKRERTELKAEAQKRGMTAATFGRALVLLGQKRLGTSSGETLIEEERIAARTRITRGARAAADARWSAGAHPSSSDEVDCTHVAPQKDDDDVR